MTDAIFFDDGLGELSPLTDLRAAFDVRTGALTTIERHVKAFDLDPVCLMVPKALEEITRERSALAAGESKKPPAINVLPRSSEPRLFINGRCPLPLDVISTLEPGQAIIERGSGDLVACVCEPQEFKKYLADHEPPVTPVGELDAPALLSRPWHVITFRDECIDADLDMLSQNPTQDLPAGVLGIGERPFTVDPTAAVYPGVTLDMEHGPIVIAEHATIRPGAVLVGPVYVGPHATVLERTLVKANTVLGPWTKVAGEVGGTIFQGYANKSHDGHLGDSYVGEWVNLGAGTTNSNLLNTYGEVIAKATPKSPNERTGRQFLGAVIGDHVKTAICTRLMTGCVLHTGGMFAQTAAVSGTTPAFAWATDAGVRTFRLEKFIEVMAAAMGRRKVKPSEAYLERVSRLQERA